MPYPRLKAESYNASGGINIKASPYATAENEQLDILNMNFNTPGSLSKRYGSTAYIGASVQGRIGGLYEFSRLSGASYFIATANTNAYVINSGSFIALRSNLLNNGIFDFVPFVDRLFMANGRDFFKTDGTQTSNFSLPPGATLTGITAAIGGGLTGTYIASYGYLNDRGYFGPGSPGVTITLDGATYGSILYSGLTTPSGYGISAISFYRSDDGQVFLYGTTQVAAGTATFIDFAPLSTRQQPEYLWFTAAPKFLELYNNQMFLGGFSNALSTVYWSDIGEPEGILPESFVEVRTNDGDMLTGIKSYSNSLVLTKQKSCHRLIGDNPTNFVVQEISDQFGCISNRAMVSYNDVIEWLDTKGIVQFNGANIQFVSNRVEHIFTSMNLTAAKENAQAIHVRNNNEVWWAIPCDGATFNNCVVVFDYLVNAWSVYKGFNPSSLAVARGIFDQDTAFYGSYTGGIFNFGSSLFGDNGNSITCSIKTRYIDPMGESTTKQYRRLFLNLDPITGFTQPITVNLRPDYGSTIAASYTMYQAPFQSEVNFGIPAKTLSAEFIHLSPSLPFKVFGWTIEYRYQRSE